MKTKPKSIMPANYPKFIYGTNLVLPGSRPVGTHQVSVIAVNKDDLQKVFALVWPGTAFSHQLVRRIPSVKFAELIKE